MSHGEDTGPLYHEFKARGYDYFVGVPCSFLKGFIKEMEADESVEFIPAAREDIALSMAVGAWMAGKKPLVYIQSSGLGHLVNAITSLLTPYEIPIHILVSLRRAPFEHFEMYRISRDLLKLMNYDNFTIVEEAEPK